MNQPVPAAADTPSSPPRSGQPWTDTEYEEIVTAAREGIDDIDEVARRLGRSPHPTLAKARRLLPVDERAAPVDRVLPLIRGHLTDPSYDWRRVTLEEPPPRPVIAPPALSGLPGLSATDLLQVGYAVGLAASVLDRDVVARVGEELDRRGQLPLLATHRADRMLDRPGSELTDGEAGLEAHRWVYRVFGRELTPDSWWGYPGHHGSVHW